MNALSHLSHAENVLTAQINQAANAINTIGAGGLSVAVERLQASVDAARERLAAARAALLSSVAGLLADLTTFADDLAGDLEPTAGQKEDASSIPAPTVEPTEPTTTSDTVTVPTALGTATVTVKTLPVPGGLLESLGMESIGPEAEQMPAELQNAVRATVEAAAAIAGRMADDDEPEEARDLLFEAEQVAACKLANDVNGGNINRKRKRA